MKQSGQYSQKMFLNAADKTPLEMEVLCSSCLDSIDFKCAFFICSEKQIFLPLGTEEKKASDVDVCVSLRLCALPLQVQQFPHGLIEHIYFPPNPS